ncbi:thiol:disulfide interchange protein [Novosphingobium sp. FSY-8]|uniref:Thiol:disulfide interchange protein n=2 Tax=Novosphingobium ovatum TaxID=1908523 RepID=A0ABW9XG26_9SPHN|nr:thiol:disulfide interchange protein [Novosphingobium ovatum]
MAALAGLMLAGVTAAQMAHAQGEVMTPAPGQARNHIHAELVAERPAKPGEIVWLALHFTPQPGWHGYWVNPGDAGFGMRLEWSVFDVAVRAAGPEQYPVPETLVVGGLMNHVYNHEYAVLVPFQVPDGGQGVVPLRLHAEWLACTDTTCVPEQANLQVAIRIGSGPADPRFEGWRARLPAPLDRDATYAMAGDRLRIAVPYPASAPVGAAHLFIAGERVVDYAAPQSFSRNGDTLIVTLKRAHNVVTDNNPKGAVLRLNEAGDGLVFALKPGVVPPDGVPVDVAPKGGDAASLPPLPVLLAMALAGGLLLNIMPCVFPILSLKALSLARAGESEAQARAEGLAYTAGVVVACSALGAGLLALRAGGEQVGWAFQLQEPGVVAALFLLALAITANLLGLFEFSVPGFVSRVGGGGRGGVNGAFATGLLAAFVATPCTGPFMASAMGAALLLPVGQAMALFVALGLGISLPFLAIAVVPALRRRMPRPGAWMGWFRRIMAVPMGLTALALAWLASRLGGMSFAGASVVLGIVVLAVLAMLGDGQRRGLARGRLALGMLAAVAVCAAVILPRTVRAPGADSTPDLLNAQPFSQDALDQARSRGKPVFLYFTADWCLSCKVNERVAIERESTRDAFAKAGVVVLKGDWTRRDPVITRFLTAQGAAGVPLYLWYPAGGGAARPLPQVLTADSLSQLAQGR